MVLSTLLPAQAFEAWGWRVPFLVALPFGLIGLYLRLRLEDTPHFQAVWEAAVVETAPLRETLSSHGRDILRVIGCIVFGTALTYLLIYLPTYMTTIVGLEQPRALAANLAGIFCLLALCPVMAILSERVGRKPFLVAPPLGAVVLALPIFLLLSESYGAVHLAHALVGSLIGIFGGVYPAAFSELFPTNVRYSSLSIDYNVSDSIFGGSAPLIFTFLLQRTDSPISPAFYVILAGVISTGTTLTIPETAGEMLRGV